MKLNPLASLACKAALIAGTAYLVFWRGESGWWFLLTLVLLEELSWKK